MNKITEIIPDDLPDWAKQAMDNGQFFKTACDRIKQLEQPTKEMTPEKIAELFHDTYEQQAPNFGYETREDTRIFDPESANGRLMISVCSRVMEHLKSGNKRFFSAGFSQGYGSQVSDIHRVEELFEKTAERLK